ncbi:MAG TPA: hypothetical protein VHI54_00405 [Actinomycetota bacterium]|nr:hypothetical protein [Actinomycetota bacterium]
MTIRELPIACSLDGQSRVAREEDWNEFLAETMIERRPIAGGVALQLQPSPQAVSRLRRLIESEQSCCPWIRWTITEGDVLSVEATSPREDGEELLARWFGVSDQR